MLKDWFQEVAQSKTKWTNTVIKNPQQNSWAQSVEQSKKNYIMQSAQVSSIQQVDKMTGAQFEEYMAAYFCKQGYYVIHTPLSGDFGVDLIIQNDFFRCGIQLKRSAKCVSLKAVQEIVAGLKHYGLHKGMVITNNMFQQSARILANDNGIVLWDRTILIEKLSTK